MNKRVREKVAARKANNHASDAAKDQVKPLAEALKDAQMSAINLGRSVVASVQESASEAFEHLKGKIVEQEEHAEHLLEKLPAVGPVAAKKLHEYWRSSARARTRFKFGAIFKKY